MAADGDGALAATVVDGNTAANANSARRARFAALPDRFIDCIAVLPCPSRTADRRGRARQR
ncbi:MAG: hypothetical protein FJ293_05300 [Planctomycetes bacterium]|nr:hypothetical protein [Planctomycetota bacterium]